MIKSAAVGAVIGTVVLVVAGLYRATTNLNVISDINSSYTARTEELKRDTEVKRYSGLMAQIEAQKDSPETHAEYLSLLNDAEVIKFRELTIERAQKIEDALERSGTLDQKLGAQVPYIIGLGAGIGLGVHLTCAGISALVQTRRRRNMQGRA